MNSEFLKPSARAWLAGLAVVLVLFESGPWSFQTRGQVPISGSGSGFRGSEKDAQGRRVDIRGQGFRTRPSDGLIEIKGMIIESVRSTNSSLIIEMTEGIFDPKAKIAFSTNAISVRMSDGRFAIEGTGFRFGMSDSRLTISNNVHSVIRKSPASVIATNAPTSVLPSAAVPKVTEAPGSATNGTTAKLDQIEIEANQFDYLGDVAVFSGKVRAEDGENLLTCAILRALFAGTGNDLSRVEAEQNVVFEQAGVRTMSDRAVYLPADELATLTGRPSWKIGDMEGSGERLVVNNKTREFHVEREVRVKLPQQGMLALDWRSVAASTNALSQTNLWIMIQSDDLRYRPTGALFQGNVRVSDPQGAELRCGVLTNWFSAPGGKLAGVIVERNVEFRQGDLWVRGDKGIYETNSEFITLTGAPTWRTPQGEGKGDVLLINSTTRQILALGNVAMKLSGPGLASLDLSFQKQGTNSLTRTNQEFLIVADELYYRSSSVIFLHRIKVTSPQEPEHELSCEVLAAFFAGTENKLDQLVAEDHVEVRQGTLRAHGGKAVFWVPKGMLELTGQPQIDEPGRTYRSDKILFNRRDGTVQLIGSYRIELDVDAIRTNTNAFRRVATKNPAASPPASNNPEGLK